MVKGIDGRRNLVLVPSRDIPLLLVDHPVRYQHMLREADRPAADAVFSYLIRQHRFTAYLGGAVADEWIFNTDRKAYGDVDILAVAEDSPKKVRASNQAATMALKRAAQAASGIQIGDVGFYVQDLVDIQNMRHYMNLMNISERFRLTGIPKASQLENSAAGTGLYLPKIDITIISGSQFRKLMKEK